MLLLLHYCYRINNRRGKCAAVGGEVVRAISRHLFIEGPDTWNVEPGTVPFLDLVSQPVVLSLSLFFSIFISISAYYYVA